jgi:pimeloyl-ACP methyl ester carboxylesterase
MRVRGECGALALVLAALLAACEVRGAWGFAAAVPAAVAKPASGNEKCVVWYTPTDLRVTDHEGLVASASGACVVPLFVFDETQLRADGPQMAELTNYAVRDLKSSLQRDVGLELICRVGRAEEHVAEVVRQVDASVIYVHDSQLASIVNMRSRVLSLLPDDIEVRVWDARLQGDPGVKDLASVWDYPSYRKLIEAHAPRPFLDPPALGTIPTLELADLDVGEIPAIYDTVRISRATTDAGVAEAFETAHPPFGHASICKDGFGEKWALRMLEKYIMEGETALGRSLFAEEAGSACKSMESAAIKRIIAAKGFAGLAPGEVLSRALSSALSLGCISPRRVWAARSWGVAESPLTVQRPIVQWEKEIIEWREWHETLSRRTLAQSSAQDHEDGLRTGFWRWNGWLCRYFEGGSSDPNAPTLVLVHGFGASGDQFRRCFKELRKEKYKLWAVDLIGFGHSTKPPLTYTQYMWSDFVRDFGLHIIGTPFFVAGNSIGGYTSMGVAADSASLCKGVVLLNSAGRLLGPQEYEAELQKQDGRSVADLTLAGELGKYSAPPNALLSMISAGLFLYLKSRIRSTCQRVYPTRPDRVDDGLADNILRDCLDPGALGIFNAGAKLPMSRSANEMLAKFGGPVLVAQGLLDPLNNAPARAKQFKEAYSNVEVVEIDGGHCPHHEMAEEVCTAISAFIDRTQGQTRETRLVTGPVLERSTVTLQ